MYRVKGNSKSNCRLWERVSERRVGMYRNHSAGGGDGERKQKVGTLGGFIGLAQGDCSSWPRCRQSQ